MTHYRDEWYLMDVKVDTDVLQVNKHGGTEWCDISMKVNNQPASIICIRSERHLEALHFMLGQLLRKA